MIEVHAQLPTTEAVEKLDESPKCSLHALAHLSSSSYHPMASVYRCASCGTDLNLSPAHLFPPNAYFEAGNKGTLSFSWVDDSKLRFTKEDKIKPFFETVNYWGIQRKRTKMQCDACGFFVGYIYDDGPPMMQGIGQFGMGPSQVIPRCPSCKKYGASYTGVIL